MLELIKAFGDISGYAISNTVFLLLDENERVNTLREDSQFKVVDQITYLGIQIATNLAMIVKTNYEPLEVKIA